MTNRLYLIIFVLFLLTLTNAFNTNAQDSLKQNNNSLVALPFAYYTPETEFAFGVGSIYSFRPSGTTLKDRPSNVKIGLTYTQRKQTIITFVPEIYFNHESIYFNGLYNYYKYPDKFWGIGNKTPDVAEEDYEPSYLKTFTNLQKLVLPGLYIGIRYQFEYIKLNKTDENGVLQYGTVPGSEDGIASGIGFILNYDTRNNIYFPTKGRYYQIYSTFFDKSFGSDYKFTFNAFDLREYYPVFDKHVLAFQTYNLFINGKPPFQMLALMGGSYWMRGYWFGRYRDKNMITFQAEYRAPLFWRFGAVGFLGFGDVAANMNEFQLTEFKYSAGFGLRFMFDKQERINARLDFGFGKGNNSGIYALVIEAY